MLKKKIFLTSAFAVCIACPAFAVDGNELIENGDTCNNTNLGTYEGTANVEAIWTIDPRTCSAGQSYDSTTNTCITCTAGNYCPGGTFNVNSQTNGLNACPNGYALSESGAGADTDCYRQCTTTDVAHSTDVSGGYYYGDNNQCSATSCAQGWHLKEGVNLSNVDVANLNRTTSAYIKNDGIFLSDFGGITHDREYWGWTNTDTNVWANDFSDGSAIQGKGLCSTKNGNGSTYLELTDESGKENAKYCWCNMTGYRNTPISAWQEVNSAYVYATNVFYREDGCSTESCSAICSSFMNSYDKRILLFDTANTLASCEANNIALKWYNDNTEVVPENNAAEQCTYNETITVPTNEPQKTGYTFGGWKLKTTTQEP